MGQGKEKARQFHAYTEDQLVEQPAIQFFTEMGWLMMPRTNFRRTRDLLSRLLSGQVVLDLAEELSQDTVESRAAV